MKRNSDPVFAGNYPRIPDGDYDAVVTGTDKKNFHRRTKLYVKFKIFSGPYVGTELFMPLNMSNEISPYSKFYKEWVKANGGVAPAKSKCMSPKVFKGKPFLITTRTVDKKGKQAKLPEHRYSVVAEIKDVLVGQPRQQQPKTLPR